MKRAAVFLYGYFYGGFTVIFLYGKFFYGDFHPAASPIVLSNTNSRGFASPARFFTTPHSKKTAFYGGFLLVEMFLPNPNLIPR